MSRPQSSLRAFAYTALLCAPATLFYGCGGANREAASPAYKKLTEAVYASGTLQAANQYNVFSPVSGILQEEFAKDGSIVKRGDKLFTIQSEAPLKAQNSSELLRLASIGASDHSPALAELEYRTRSAYDQYVSDSLGYARQQDLLANQATSQVEVEKARLALGASRNSYYALRSSARQTRLDMEEKLQNARVQYKLAANDKDNASIVSLVDGKVYKVFKSKGEMITAQEPIAIVGDGGEFILKLSVDERDVSKVALNQKVVFKTDLLAGTTFTATVSKIYPYLDPETRSVRVDALARVPNLQAFVGASVEANIVTMEKEKALIIPKVYLHGEDSVWVEQDGKPARVKIKKGIENLEVVEVIEGLRADSRLLKDGNL